MQGRLIVAKILLDGHSRAPRGGQGDTATALTQGPGSREGEEARETSDPKRSLPGADSQGRPGRGELRPLW